MDAITHIGKVARAVTTRELEKSGRFLYEVFLPEGMGEPFFTNSHEENERIAREYGNISILNLKTLDFYRMEYVPKGA